MGPPTTHTSPWLLHTNNSVPVLLRQATFGTYRPGTGKTSITLLHHDSTLQASAAQLPPPHVTDVCITFAVSMAATILNNPVVLAAPEDRFCNTMGMTIVPADWGVGTHRHCMSSSGATGRTRFQGGEGVQLLEVGPRQTPQTHSDAFFMLPNTTVDNTQQDWVFDRADCLGPGCGLVCPADKQATPSWATVFTGQHSPVCRLVDAQPVGHQTVVAGSPFANGLSQDLCAPPYYSEWTQGTRSVQCGACETETNPFPFPGVGVASRTGARDGDQSDVWWESRHHITSMTPTGWPHCLVLREVNKTCGEPCPRDCLFQVHSSVARVPPICHEAGRSREWWETIASVSFTRDVRWRENDTEKGGLSCATQHRRQMETFQALGLSGWCDEAEGIDGGDGSRVTLTFKPAPAGTASRIQNETGVTLCKIDHQYLNVCPVVMGKAQTIGLMVSLSIGWFAALALWIVKEHQGEKTKSPNEEGSFEVIDMASYQRKDFNFPQLM